ncbi:MAG TPA: signal peptide peptidase SppA [Deltaproteobacteria bacterium]|nr:signal peptide peptidase SppA [Deltaproteobacteria bacterium]
MKKGFWLLLLSFFILALSGIVLIFAFLLADGTFPLFPRKAVAVVEIKGGIFDPTETLEQLDRVYRNDALKALILRIDSPGGGVSASQEIYQAVLRVKEKKKVIVSMGTVAASGGYYIAVAADKIVALPGTVTGSIGVLMDHANVEELLKFLKIHAEVLKSGKLKDVGSPLRSLTQEERAYLQALLDDMHRQFKAAVAEGRRLPLEVVDKLADGRVFTGEQAKALKLIDELGGRQKAVEIAQQMLGLEEEPEILYPKKKKTGLLELLMEGETESVLLKLYYFLREGRALYWTNMNRPLS